MAEFRFTCALEHGLHARPASVLAEALRPFRSRAQIVKESSGRAADLRSVLSVVALDIARNEQCIIRAEGDDAESAVQALRDAIERGVGEAGALAAEQSGAGQPARVPAGLRRLGVRWLAGRTIAPGCAVGPVVLVGAAQADADEQPAAGDPDAEIAIANEAIRDVHASISARQATAATDFERDLLRAHASIADDPALREQIRSEISRGASATAAVRRAAAHFRSTLAAATSQYVRERALDMDDVSQQLLERLGAGAAPSIELAQPSIVVADLLTPRQIMSIDRNRLLALVLGGVGATSHTAIIARGLGIPAIADVNEIARHFAEGDEIIVDADGGFVVPALSESVKRYYAVAQRAAELRRKRLQPFLEAPATSRDGVRLEIAANVSSADDVSRAIEQGAESIGLFRTELLFLDRSAPPSEDEQFETYRRAVANAGGRSVIFRTFDIGGDKPAPYLRLPREENPFLGWRGVRLYDHFPELVRMQLRALVRASAAGPIKVMAPMISSPREAETFVGRVREIQQEARSQGLPFDDGMPVGIMVEVPSAALAIDQLASLVDFFSIGTNDLTQYFFASDRGNPRVAALCEPLQPSFVRLLARIVEQARQKDRWVGVCGEMAGDIAHLPLMLGLEVDEISVPAARVLELKAALASLDASTCRALVAKLQTLRDAEEVRSVLSQAVSATGSSALVEPALVDVQSEAATKIEALRQLVGQVVAAGRARDEVALEEAVWAREDTYSTALGFGFAVPHCKSAAVLTPTIAVAKFQSPIDWGAADGEPVRIAMLLAIPDAGTAAQAARTHMQILATLARKLMHEEFREALAHAATAEALVDVLAGSLQP